jgi:hypothetical protein
MGSRWHWHEREAKRLMETWDKVIVLADMRKNGSRLRHADRTSSRSGQGQGQRPDCSIHPFTALPLFRQSSPDEH